MKQVISFFRDYMTSIFENYRLSFSGSSRKKIKAELQKLEKLKISYRFNEQKDLDHSFQDEYLNPLVKIPTSAMKNFYRFF